MNKTGRPRSTSGSLYLRRDSRVWWMSYRDRNGRFKQESTGQRAKGEAEKVMRKRLVARDEGLLPSAAPDAGIRFEERQTGAENTEVEWSGHRDLNP